MSFPWPRRSAEQQYDAVSAVAAVVAILGVGVARSANVPSIGIRENGAKGNPYISQLFEKIDHFPVRPPHASTIVAISK
jgi:hypothetical protein